MTDRGYEKPVVKLADTDGNIFALWGRCTKALKDIGHSEIAKRMTDRVFAARNYNEALSIMIEYVDAE
jgi:hypothetical protein